jgi:hypothetical protein
MTNDIKTMKTIFVFMRQLARLNLFTAILVMLAAPGNSAASELPDTSRDNMLVHRDGDTVSLDTQTGTVLTFTKIGGSYGLGTLVVNGQQVGAPVPYFFRGDVYGQRYTAKSVSVDFDDGELAKVVFSGRDMQIDMRIEISVMRNVAAFGIDYTLTPVKPVPDYLAIDFPFDHQKMTLVQRPLSAPVGAGWEGVYYFQSTHERVPLIFARMNAGTEEVFLGAGYHLETDQLPRGRIVYDSRREHPFSLTFPYKLIGNFRGKRQHFTTRFVIAASSSQGEMIRSYAALSGFEPSVPFVRTTREAADGLYKCYRNAAQTAYVKGKGYHFKLFASSGKPCLKDYGRFVAPSYNPHIAWHLYEYWAEHRTEGWAREVAEESVNFYLENQQPSGAVVQLWDSTRNVYQGFNRHNNQFLYNACHLSVGSYGLLRFADAVEQHEKRDGSRYREAGLRALRYLARQMDQNGKLGRSYDEEGNYDTLSPEVWTLLAFDYAATLPGGEAFAEYRDRLERFTLAEFVRDNHWMNWSSDATWHEAGPMPNNYDNFMPMSFVAYCMRRYAATQEDRYLDLAKDVFWFSWLGTIPVQIPGYKHVTKGLSFEQDFYQTYDIPFRVCSLIDGLPLLSEATGDPFYVEYFTMLLQTQFYYQAIDTDYPSFYIGLWMPTKETDGNPLDEIGETDMCYMVEWPFMFLESLRSDLWRDAVEIGGIRYDVNAPRVPSPDAEVSVPKSQAAGKR